MLEMTRKQDRLEALVRRALHESTPLEEARTSAMIALRLAVQRNLLIPNTTPPPPVDNEAIREAAYQEGYSEGYEAGCAATKALRTVIGARFDGQCRFCGRPWTTGDKIAWSREHGAACLKCRAVAS